jgi:hypothetical protein
LSSVRHDDGTEHGLRATAYLLLAVTIVLFVVGALAAAVFVGVFEGPGQAEATRQSIFFVVFLMIMLAGLIAIRPTIGAAALGLWLVGIVFSDLVPVYPFTAPMIWPYLLVVAIPVVLLLWANRLQRRKTQLP